MTGSCQTTDLCATYVKVGLWYAGYGPADKEIGRGVGSARDMGSALTHESAGFRNISASLPKIKITVGNTTTPEQPEITFSLPGDVIVYQKRTDPTADGHIDVRTYHGFISDFVWPGRNGLPDLRLYKVTGVYRKYTDTVAEARVEAFLRIIRENAAKGFDDHYYAHKIEGGKHISFTDVMQHPYASSEENKPAGAYQIKWAEFKRCKDATGWPSSFTPQDQDRAAIYELQGRDSGDSYPRKTALGYVMEGKVEQAVNDTKLWKLFAFLPGGGKEQLIDMAALKKTFEKYTTELSK